MSTVQTVLGPIPASNLGLTLSHEHLLCRPPGDAADADPDLVLDAPEAALAELATFKAAGGATLIEVTPIDYGRDLEGLAELSRLSGVHIVAATGLHKEQWSAEYTSRLDEDQLADMFTRELLDGVNGVKPGVIKIGSSLERIMPGERKVFNAAALAQRATDAPITTHTEAGRLGLEQLDLLIGAGADPERIVIGHIDRRLDLDYHEAMLRAGAYIAYDQVGKPKYATDERRAEALAVLVGRGHGSKLLISGDLGRKSYWKTYDGSPGLGYIPTTFLGMLCAAGLTTAQAEELVVDNPARAFG
ncbi:MAG TPA: phosphotriesterase-related protein [Candidatus Dormibacteraeota bacterium]|nr:phosphotriesterase-related protein [Candidatus Dormibacteraeota bacterium]